MDCDKAARCYEALTYSELTRALDRQILPSDDHERQAFDIRTRLSLTNRGEKVKQAQALTTIYIPRLSQRLQQHVVNDANAQTLCSDRHCPLRTELIPLLGRLLREYQKALFGTIVGSMHVFIFQWKLKCLNRYELCKHSSFQVFFFGQCCARHNNCGSHVTMLN